MSVPGTADPRTAAPGPEALRRPKHHSHVAHLPVISERNRHNPATETRLPTRPDFIGPFFVSASEELTDRDAPGYYSVPNTYCASAISEAAATTEIVCPPCPLAVVNDLLELVPCGDDASTPECVAGAHGVLLRRAAQSRSAPLCAARFPCSEASRETDDVADSCTSNYRFVGQNHHEHQHSAVRFAPPDFDQLRGCAGTTLLGHRRLQAPPM
jgi:hypothetical protein